MKSGHLNNLTEKLYSGNFLSRTGKYLRRAGLAALLTATVGIGYVGCEREEKTYQQSKIAFISERDGNKEIYVMNSDGSEQKNLTNNPAGDYSSSWSPDGKKIAFTSGRDGNGEIYVMNADGSEHKRLTNNRAFDMFPSWSPDGKKIAFQSKRDGNGEIYVMNSDGTEQKRLTNNPALDFLSSWLPFL